jgi:hypothetical protein
MAEFEELRLTVNLVDNASSGLQRLRVGLGDLTKSTDAMTQSLTTGVAAITNLGTVTASAAPHVRSIAQATREASRSVHELKDGFMRMNVATQGLSSLPQIASNVRDLGFAVRGLSSAYSLIGTAASVAVGGIAAIAVAVVGLGAVVVAYGVSVFKFAGEMDQLSRTAKQMGMGFASLKYATDQAKQFGYSADMVIRSYQGIQAAQLDLYKNNSQLRATLLGQGVDAGWIAQLSKLDPNQARSAIIRYGKQLEAQALASGAMKGNARRLMTQFLKEFGLTAADADMPELKPPSPEKRRQLEDVERYSKLIRGVWGQMTFEWTKFKTELLATHLPILRDSMIKLKGRMPAILKELRIWIEYAVSFLPGLVDKIPIVVKKVGVLLKGVISIFQGTITALKYMTSPWKTLRSRAHPALQKLMGWDEFMSKENEEAWAARRRQGNFSMWDKEMWSLSRVPTDEELRAQGMERVKPGDYPDALTPAMPPTPPPGQYGPRQGPWVPPHLRRNMSYSGGSNDNNPLLTKVSFTQNELKDEVGSASEEMAKLTRQLERLNDYIDRAGGGGSGGGGFRNVSFGGSAGAAAGGGYGGGGGGGYSGGGGRYGGASGGSGYNGGGGRSGGGGPAETGAGAATGAQSGLKAGSAGAGGNLAAGRGGQVDPQAFYKSAVERFKNSPLNGFVPRDGDKWGIKTGSPEEWARLATATAQQESSFNANAPNGGLFQMNAGDLARYGQKGAAVNDPNAQLNAAAKQWETAIPKSGAVAEPGGGPGSYSGWRGAGAYFGSMRYGPGSGHGAEPDIAKYMRPGGFADKVAAAAGAASTDTAAAPTNSNPTAGTAADAGIIDASKDVGRLNYGGKMENPQGLLVHHTGAREKSPQQLADVLRSRTDAAPGGLSVQYFIGRDSKIYQITPKGVQAWHAGSLPTSMAVAGKQLGNQNLIGVEVAGKGEKDILPGQRQAVAKLYGTLAKENNWSANSIWGHGELAGGRKDLDEGTTAKLIREGKIAVPRETSVAGVENPAPPPVAANSNIPELNSGNASLPGPRTGKQPDSSAINRESLTADKAADVQTDGKLKADVSAPAGTKVSVEGSGAFKNTETSRSTTMSRETANKLLATN